MWIYYNIYNISETLGYILSYNQDISNNLGMSPSYRIHNISETLGYILSYNQDIFHNLGLSPSYGIRDISENPGYILSYTRYMSHNLDLSFDNQNKQAVLSVFCSLEQCYCIPYNNYSNF